MIRVKCKAGDCKETVWVQAQGEMSYCGSCRKAWRERLATAGIEAGFPRRRSSGPRDRLSERLREGFRLMGHSGGFDSDF